MSMVFNFFASQGEVIAIWNWIAELPNVELLEADSRPDLPNRKFARFPESEFEMTGRDFSVVAWSNNVGSPPRKKYIKFERVKAICAGAGRTVLTSPAFVHLNTVSPPNSDLMGRASLFTGPRNWRKNRDVLKMSRLRKWIGLSLVE
jgi:hypothetical protein